MTNDPKGQDVNEEGKPQEPMPSSKPTEGDLPEDTSPRTAEQFEKLKESNKALKERLDALEASKEETPDVLNSLRPQANPFTASQPQVNEPVNSDQDRLVSEDGTQVDPYLLEKSLRESKTAAEEARKEALAAREDARRYAETQQVRDAHGEFPQLNPKSPDYDPNFYKAVKNEVVGQMTQGYQDLVSAAKSVSEWYKLNPTKKDQADKAADETQTQKDQINATAPARPMSMNDTDHLASRQRKGDREATVERLSRSGY